MEGSAFEFGGVLELCRPKDASLEELETEMKWSWRERKLSSSSFFQDFLLLVQIEKCRVTAGPINF